MNKKIINRMALGYLLLPLLIFAVGYLKWYVAVVTVIVASVAVWQVCRSLADTEVESRPVPWQPLLLGVAVAITFLLGVGGYYTQSGDFVAKNPILNDLVLEPWPVIVRPQTMSQEIQQICGSQPLGLVYYFFFYLPAACVGKVAGIAAARFALFVWTAAGLYILLNQLAHYLNKDKGISKRQIWLLVILLVFFGGMDIIPWIFRRAYDMLQERFISYGMEGWCNSHIVTYFTYYASHWTSLYLCFNQSIPIWMMTALVVDSRKISVIGFFYSFTLLYSPWAAMGMLPIVAFYAVSRMVSDTRAVRQVFSFPNIVFPLCVLLLVGTFYMSNNTPLEDKGWFWEFLSPSVFVVRYVAFIAVELGVYVYLLRSKLGKDWLLTASVITLLLIPLYKMTGYNDFLMRASLPALFVVFMFWLRWCFENWRLKRRLIIVIVFLSSFVALQSMATSFRETVINKGASLRWPDEQFCNTDNPKVADLGELQFFAHDYGKTFFWKYLAR